MVSCHIKDKNNFVFIAEEPMEEPDPFEMRAIKYIQYYGENFQNKNNWSNRSFATETKAYLGWITKPTKNWVFVSFWGRVLRASDKIDKEKNEYILEEDIPPLKGDENTIISKVKVINGKMYTVSGGREVRRRDGENQWTILDKGFPTRTKDDTSNVGFIDIDGFSENDIYAAGNGADIWNWNGKVWTQIEIPTNVHIKGVCCAGDGQVYLSSSMDSFIIGRGDRWKIIKHDLDMNFRNMVWFKDRVYMAAGSTLYEIKEGKFKESKLNDMKDRPVDWSCLDANDDIMLAGSKLEVATFDGEKFTTVIPFEMG